VATLPPNVTVPVILVPALFFRVKVDVVTVVLCTASLKVAVIELVTATPVATSLGLVLVTVGGVVSVCAAVVNDQLLGVREFPAKSFIPLVTAAV
jgi:hypothetical protein